MSTRNDIPSRDITPKETYFNRRTLLRGAALVGGVAATAGLYRLFSTRGKGRLTAETLPAAPTTQVDAASGFKVDEPLTPLADVAGYNNFYEFSTDKYAVAGLASGFVTKPWTLAVGGLVARPRTFGLEDLEKLAPLEERIYRHRCVEAWSMVIPWLGYPLAALLKAVEPRSDAKYVAFETLQDPERMPNQRYDVLPWPYVEGLRMDEAMHPLTLLSLGLYGQKLLPQNGAPVRLVCPWKYGFKGCKSIVKITLVAEEPPATWNVVAPSEYGFYCNVNPAVDHPRWSQAQERRLPAGDLIPTLPFNGYAGQVAHLYAGMDLKKHY